MNKLLSKYNDFKTINNYRFKYSLENDVSIEFKVSQYHFAHLIGIHKLIDLPIIQRFNNKTDSIASSNYLNYLIRKEYLTDEIITKSKYFGIIKNRYDFISSDNILSLTFNEVIIDFDASIAYSKLKTDFLLIETKENGYLHLGLRKTSGLYFPETFFFRQDDKYLKGQNVLKVKHFEIYNENNDLIFEIDL